MRAAVLSILLLLGAILAVAQCVDPVTQQNCYDECYDEYMDCWDRSDNDSTDECDEEKHRCEDECDEPGCGG